MVLLWFGIRLTMAAMETEDNLTAASGKDLFTTLWRRRTLSEFD